MAVYLIKMFGGSLFFTLVLELAAAYLFGLRARENILLVVLVNILTNPPAVLACWLGRMYLAGKMPFLLELAAEAAAVIVEACVYTSFSHVKGSEIKHPVLLAVSANLCSWMIGRSLSYWDALWV